MTKKIVIQENHRNGEPKTEPRQETKKTGRNGAHTIPAQMF